ncbi:S8 family peptidase [Azohydromonas australica]|uniref:S8 family peptidase n=1 Tax=Azohydromonas australica TaxID=364039 RepID=UPI0004065268|nr:S8 family peptidase [Azohydromonas australica]
MSKHFKPSASLLALAAATFITLQAAPAAAFVSSASAGDTAELTDRLIVKYRSATEAAPSEAAKGRAMAALQGRGAKLGYLRRMGNGAHVFKLDKALSAAELRQVAKELRAGDADIEYVEPDLVMQPQFTPNDPSYAQQWHYFESTAGINAPAAWEKSTGAGVVVAVIDTGVRPHADLAANLLPGYDFISDATLVSNDGTGRDTDPADPGDWVTAGQCATGSAAANSSWHGTHVSGTIAAVTNNSVGVSGVAFDAKVLPVRALGRCGGYTSDIADGMIWAAGGTVSGVPANANPAKVLNLSLGATAACSTTYQNAVTIARNFGATVVVAAGNKAIDAVNFAPANCTGVVVVAAVNRSGGRASYSDYGTLVDLAAPGGDTNAGVLSTLNAGTTVPAGDNYVNYMGTSMAAPHVAATAALMLSLNPLLTPDQVESRLKASVRAFPATCSGCGTGILDANMAVDAAGTAPAITSVAEAEANDSIAAAQVLGAALPVSVSGTISKLADKDLYKVDIPVGGSILARLRPNASSNYDLVAFDAATGTQLAASNQTGALADQVILSNTGSNVLTVALQVSRVSGLTGASGTYSLYVSPNN